MTDIKIINFNLLVDNYCKPDFFIKASANATNSTMRYQLLISILQEHINNSTDCFCLQEVTRNSGSKLRVFFKDNGFDTAYDNYGYYKNGYMGIMVAWKNTKFKMISEYSENVGDNIPYQKPKVWSWNDTILNRLGYKPDHAKHHESLMYAKRRDNIFMAIELQTFSEEIPKSFYLCNYHMPCCYYDLMIMNLHASRLQRVVTKLSKKLPTIFCGDFNSMPDSDLYKMFTNDTQPFRSAYQQINNCEPDATTHCITQRNDKPIETFKAVLDYCFVSNMDVKSAQCTSSNVPMPNDNWPSDHCLLTFDFTLNDK